MVVSTGVGGGIVLNQQLLEGDAGNAGHIGHVIVEPDGRTCACGAQGCLEAEASGPSIARATGKPAHEADAATIERTGTLVGRGIASVVNLLDLRLALVGGSVALGTAEADGAAAQSELDATLQLREALFRLFAAQARREQLPPDDVASVTRCFDIAVDAFGFELRAGQLVHVPRAAPGQLDVVRLQCAVSAVALLCGAHARKVKECADDRGCGRLFVDLTRNRSRRYCLSAECGNRARQAAFRERHRPLTRPSGILSPQTGRGKG